MKKEQFNSAVLLMNDIKNAEALLDASIIINKSDEEGLHDSILLHVKQKNIDTGCAMARGAHQQPIYEISRFSDGSGASLQLTIEENIKLAHCIKEIVQNRLDSAESQLSEI